MANYSIFVERIKSFLQVGDLELPQIDLDEAIAAAVSEHSEHVPYIQYDIITGDSGDPADYDLHADWVPQWSEVLEVEYPTGNNPRTLLESDSWEIYYDGANTKYQFRFLSASPTSSETAQMKITTRHTLTQDTDTTAAKDFTAVCVLATAYAYLQLSAKYTQTQEPTLTADVINYQDKGAQYVDRSNNMRTLYFRAIGKSEDQQLDVAGTRRDWDSEFADQVDYITHPKDWR